MPNIPETLIAFLATREHRRDLVERRAGVRRAQRDRPLRADRAEGAAGGRRLPPRRQGLRPHARRRARSSRSCRRSSTSVRAALPERGCRSRPARDGARSPGSELLAPGRGHGAGCFEQVPFDHPLWVLYSSGTTGLPKAIVQGHGGILLEQLKKRLHLDLRRGRPHVLVHDDGLDDVELPRRRACSRDAAIVLYDGSPAHPDLGVLWELAERAGITCMGVSAGAARELREGGRRAGARPRPERAAGDRLHRARRCRRRASAGSTSTSARRLAVLDERRHGRVHRVRRRAARCCRSTRANCSAARSAARWRPGTSRAAASSMRWGSW